MSEQNPVPPHAQYGGGQPVPPQAPPQGGYPAGPPAPPYGTPGEPMPAAPQQSGGGGKKISSLVGIVVVILIAVGWFVLRGVLNQDKTADAKAGDCIAALDAPAEGETTDASKAKVVDCASQDAKFTVVGRVEDKTEAQFDADEELKMCSDAGFVSEYMVWSGERGGNGYILCLNPKQ